MLVLKGLVGLHKTVQLQLLQHYWLGYRLNKPRSHIKKQRHYFANKGPSIKAMVFPVVMNGCESWTIKRRLSAKELMILSCGVGEDS